MIRGYCVRVTYRGLGADEQIEWTRRLSEVIARSLGGVGQRLQLFERFLNRGGGGGAVREFNFRPNRLGWGRAMPGIKHPPAAHA